MYNFQYVSKERLEPVKQQLLELIHLVQNDVRAYFTFQYRFVGSSARNMVTYDVKSNVGFDFDVDLMVNDDDEKYSPEEIRHILMRSFDKHARRYRYWWCEDNTRVFTIKVKDIMNSKIKYKCDFAIVNNYGNNRQQYIRFNKETKECFWAEQAKGFRKLPEKIEFCKKNGLWQSVHSLYLEKKNNNTVKEKKSRSIFAEAVHEVCQKNGYKQ